MKLTTTFLILVLLATEAFATAQAPDVIIYKGKKYDLLSNPMEIYFNQYPEKKPTSGIISTALWRGYIANFEVINRELFVIDITIMTYDSISRKYDWISVMDEVFQTSEKVKVDWMTGLLVIPRGRMKNYVHMGYASSYSRYTLLEIESGMLKREKKFNRRGYEKFKERQFLAFKQTEEYQKIRDMYLNWDEPEEFIDSFLRIYIIDYTSKILID
jgi:hypothetical protein